MSVGKQNLVTWLMGIGLVLFIAHVHLGSLDKFVFLPWVGMGLIAAVIITVLNGKEKIEYGQKKLWIPMLVISVSIMLSAIYAIFEGRIILGEFIGAIFIAFLLFAIYLTSLKLGTKIFKALSIASMIEAVSIPIWAAFHKWYPNGGLVSATNYDIATGVVILGILVSPKKHWWWMSIVGTVGLLFSGSAEAILSGLVLLVVALFSKVEKKKILAPIGALVVIGIIAIPIGVFTSSQAPNMQRLSVLALNLRLPPNDTFWIAEKSKADSIVSTPIEAAVLDKILGYRISNFQLSPIKPFGYGINLTNFYWGIPHNIFLIIIEQVGILALIAWCFLVGLGIKNKETRVLFIGFLSLGLVDHYIWTQAAVWFPALIGSYLGGSVAVNNQKDYLYNKGYQVSKV